MIDALFMPRKAVSLLPLPYDDRNVVSALQSVLETAEFDEDGPTDQDLTKIIVQAARHLMRQRDVGSACRVIGAAPPRLRLRFPLRMQLVKIFSWMGELDLLTNELTALLRKPREATFRDEILSMEASRIGLGWRVGGDCRVKPALWGKLPEDPAVWVREGAGEHISPPIAARAEDARIAQLLRIAGTTPEEAAARLGPLRAQQQRAGFLYQADMKARLAGPSTPGAAEVIAYHDRYLREQVECDMSAMIAAHKSGRNAILLMAHAGSGIRFSKFDDFPGPKAIFAHAQVNKPDTLWIPTLRDNTTLAMSYVKLARTIRKAPHLVMILPDGAAGTSSTEVEVDGVTFRVALGAAALARVAPSTLFFARSLHQGGKLFIEITEGPQMGPGMDAEASDAQFAAFYAEGLRRIMHSPLEDIESFGFMRSVQNDIGEGEE